MKLNWKGDAFLLKIKKICLKLDFHSPFDVVGCVDGE